MPIIYNKPAVIDLDSFNAKAASFVEDQNKNQERLRPSIMSAVMAEVPEEEKDSNFGDYGPESDSDTENSER